MRYGLFALAASSIFGGAAARGHAHHKRHGHFPRNNGGEECVPPMVPKPCTTIVKTILVDYTPPAQTSVAPVPEVQQSTVYVQPTPVPTTIEVPHGPLPTPEVTTCPTPGIYTIPEKTITLTQTEVVCVPTHTNLPPGEHTIGGVTTVVEHQTTVVCPVAHVEGSTTTITTTTFICPTPGTYVINPITTTITESKDCDYPVVTEYPPGTYTQPETTITVTQTSQVITCPGYKTSTVVVVPVPSETKAPTEEKPPAPEEPTSTVEPVVKEVTTETPTKTTETPKETQTVVNEPGSHGGRWAITYSPYNDDTSCKSAAEVDADIADIASRGFKAIRLYSSDCSGLETVGSSIQKHGLKVIGGVFIKGGGVSTAQSQVDDWVKWGHWELVEIFVVGNEALFAGFCSAEELAAFIVEVKIRLRGEGYNGPITTTEPLNMLEAHYEVLCGAIDVMGINIHPYFNPDVEASKAGDFLNLQLDACAKLCGKTVYVLESGWPKGGNSNGKAIASPEAQQQAFASIEEKCPMDRIVVFSYRDDLWKTPGAFGVEQHFGCREQF